MNVARYGAHKSHSEGCAQDWGGRGSSVGVAGVRAAEEMQPATSHQQWSESESAGLIGAMLQRITSQKSRRLGAKRDSKWCI